MPQRRRLARHGPTWLGLYKQRRSRSPSAPPGYTLSAGDSDAKWDAYLRESILDPGAKIVQGYQNVMPSYAAQFSGSAYKDKKLTAIVEYIKSLDNHGPGGKPKYYHPMPTREAELAATSPGKSVTTAGSASAMTAPQRMQDAAMTTAHARQLPDAHPRHRLVGLHARSQADRRDVPGLVLAAFLLGGIFAMLIRTQLLTPEGLLFHGTSAEPAPHSRLERVYKTYNQFFTLHGAIMIFLVLIPGIPGALGNFVLPIMLGAKDVAFPAAEPLELLPLRHRGRCSRWPRSSSARSTPAGPSTPPTARTTNTAVVCAGLRRRSSSASARSSPASTSSSPSTSSARRA